MCELWQSKVMIKYNIGYANFNNKTIYITQLIFFTFYYNFMFK